MSDYRATEPKYPTSYVAALKRALTSEQKEIKMIITSRADIMFAVLTE